MTKKKPYILVLPMQLYEAKNLKSIKRGIERLLTESVTKTSYSDRHGFNITDTSYRIVTFKRQVAEQL